MGHISDIFRVYFGAPVLHRGAFMQTKLGCAYLTHKCSCIRFLETQPGRGACALFHVHAPMNTRSTRKRRHVPQPRGQIRNMYAHSVHLRTALTCKLHAHMPSTRVHACLEHEVMSGGDPVLTRMNAFALTASLESKFAHHPFEIHPCRTQKFL